MFKILPPNNIAITIYGTSEEDYRRFTGNGANYHKTIRALELLRNNQIPFVLRTVAARTLRESLLHGEFEKLAARFDTTFKYDPVIFPKTSGDSAPLDECMDINQIIELEAATPLRKAAWETSIHDLQQGVDFCWNCHAGVSSIAIDFQGNAFVCGLYRNHPISILHHDMDEVLAHLHKIHENHLKIVAANECSFCDKRAICKWCPAYSYIYNHNDWEKIDFFCDLADARKKAFGG